MTKSRHSDTAREPQATRPFSGVPDAFGLYDPRFEHDACGVSFVVPHQGRASRSIVGRRPRRALQPRPPRRLRREANTGDGAGILVQVPDRFLRAVWSSFELPAAGAYGVGIAFLPLDPEAAEKAMAAVERGRGGGGLRVLGWRDVPIDSSMLGPDRLGAVPQLPPALRRATPQAATGVELDRKLFVVRKRFEHDVTARRRCRRVYFPSLSSADPRLQGDAHHAAAAPSSSPTCADERVESALALVHQRFSHQHVPVVAARPPVPLPRAQRRDQHRAGQPATGCGPARR